MNNPFYATTLFSDPELLEKMLNHFTNLEWTNDTFIMHGKSVTPKRKTFMYGRNYSYSGITKKAIPFDEKITYIAKQIEIKLNLPNQYFNGCLLNLYPDGEAGLSYHKDNEPDLDKTAPIVSLSLGADRKFYLKNDMTNGIEKIIHKNGDILIMEEGSQENWTHSIPKELRVKEPRISLTFRKFN